MANMIKQGIGVMIVTILLAAVGIPLVQDSYTTDLQSVTNQTIDATRVPEVIEANETGQTLETDSEKIYAVNTSSGDTEILDKNDDYDVVSYDDGTFNVTNVNGFSNADNGEYKLSFDYQPIGYVSGITATVLSFVSVALALSVFVVSLRMMT